MIYGITDPEHDEVIAALEAIMFGYECGFNFVQMEGDAISIIDALNSSDENLSAIWGIIDDVKQIPNCFDSCTCQHINRSVLYYRSSPTKLRMLVRMLNTSD
ncbi:hypothetical protein RJ639_035350 [Escallonia herrerae]|uniref:RNase H type-1 domain-containing protein n=1 Tax=Escallonia herrerae TaxID=1293975 RepID=A0AA88WUF1_9ASTE|nr:hypothetical protein RJ639_035350 [Escallonia herrerae]